MKPEHAAWIADFTTSRSSVRGFCALACKMMREAFPELTEVRGWCNGAEHAWLVDAEGNIVDPTAAQFGDPDTEEFRRVFGPPRPLTYVAFKPGDEVRVGRCMGCGEPIYAKVDRLDDPKHAKSICSDECRADVEASLYP